MGTGIAGTSMGIAGVSREEGGGLDVTLGVWEAKSCCAARGVSSRVCKPARDCGMDWYSCEPV